jgi:hypothetical protein
MRAAWRPYEHTDLGEVLRLKLREIDQIECRAATGLTVQQSLYESLSTSKDVLWVITIDKRIIGVFGVAPLWNGAGAPWLLATDELPTITRRFLRDSKAVIDIWRRNYSCLTNFVAVENTEAIRWLTWLGFTILPQRWTFANPEVAFVQFFLHSKEHNHV